MWFIQLFGRIHSTTLGLNQWLKMAAINFQAPAALFILAVIMYTGRLNHTLPQDKVIDFGLNTTFAAKDSPGIGFEAIVRTHREQRWRHAILKRNRTSSSFLVLSLLLLSGNVELNPGPHYKHPCGCCTKPVKANQRGVQCDICDIWYHTRCMQMSSDTYEGLAAT